MKRKSGSLGVGKIISKINYFGEGGVRSSYDGKNIR